MCYKAESITEIGYHSIFLYILKFIIGGGGGGRGTTKKT